ncbi:MAG: nuclear transport factor 2 family protein [Armatimonadaceae bacterium]
MTALEVGQELVSLCRQGKHEEAIERFYANDILSVEAAGENPEVRGLDGIRAKIEWWDANNEIKRAEVRGPFPHGEQFAVLYDYDILEKTSGQEMRLEEVAVYTVKDGKIVEERFFYTM